MATHSIGERIDDDPSAMALTKRLQEYEDLYLKETAKANPSQTTKFNYAWALVRSKTQKEIKKGIIILQGLLEDDFSEKDCLYYMAIGYLRQKNLQDARLCVEQLLQSQPNCRQALSLMDIIEDGIAQQKSIGMGSVAATAVVVAALSVALVMYSRGQLLFPYK